MLQFQFTPTIVWRLSTNRRAGHETLIMHRLTARVIRESSTPEHLTTAITAATTALEQSFPDHTSTWNQRILGAHLAAHVEAIWRHCSNGGHPDDLILRLLELRSRTIRNRNECQDLPAAVRLSCDLVRDYEEILGPDHPDTLTTRNNLAYAYQAAGRLPEAIDLYETTRTEIERNLGPDHPHTLTARNNLAHAYQAAGRLTEATDLLMPDGPTS